MIKPIFCIMDIIVAISYQSLVIVVALPFLDRVSLFRLIYIQIKCIPFLISLPLRFNLRIFSKCVQSSVLLLNRCIITSDS